MGTFNIIKKSNSSTTSLREKSLARVGKLQTAHGVVNTPVFMSVGTVGAVKTVSPDELRALGAEIILGNTYHLYLRPGEKLIQKFGGLQKFNCWNGPILTDSGGFQVFSLGNKINQKSKIKSQNDKSKLKINNLVKISEKGVEFKSHLDGSKHFFTPEKVIDIQLALGSDIIMVLDVCTEYPASYKRAKETMEITHLWAKRSINYWNKIKYETRNPKFETNSNFQNSKLKTKLKSEILNLKSKMLFGISQGSVYKDLRIQSAKYIGSLGFDGVAVGGVSVGEGKINMKKVIRWVAPYLPEELPHYLMGVGEPEDLIFATKYGFDMFDCVLPTRLARHGVFWTKSPKGNIKSQISNNPDGFTRGEPIEDPRQDKVRRDKQYQNSKFKFSKHSILKARFKNDKKVLNQGCGCYTCQSGFSRAYLSHLVKEKEMLGLRLLTIHNLYTLINLMKQIKENI